jgi:hypothetical protein
MAIRPYELTRWGEAKSHRVNKINSSNYSTGRDRVL